MTRVVHALVPALIVLAALDLIAVPAKGQKPPPAVEWPYYGGDQGGMKYSPLSDINRKNVSQLRVAWEWKTGERALEQFKTLPGAFQVTPLMIDDVLYLSTPYNRVVALDAETGRERWAFDPKAYEDGPPFSGQGFIHRGVAAWRDNGRLRIFMNSRHRLFALDAETGRPVPSFGDGGAIDLAEGLVWSFDKKHYANTSPPVVYKDLVIVGSGIGDRLTYRNDPPGDVRAFDAKTGKLVWTFHTIPQQGEVGNDSWENDSWKFTGHTNVWPPMTLDETRGLLYMPVSTPSNDYYGGRRPGANLFAESLVCLDAATGARRWHFQITHHGVWDYDPPSPPNLVTIRVNGRRIDAVVQLTKQGFAFVFDRVTGQPVWPIAERPVPPSDVPGERAWPTQPFPSRPPAFTAQGVTLDDAFDLSPELRSEAQAEMKKFRLGPLYTPPSMEGTLTRPGVWGGANWGGGGFDPEAGILYLKTTGLGQVFRIQRVEPTESGTRPPSASSAAEVGSRPPSTVSAPSASAPSAAPAKSAPSAASASSAAPAQSASSVASASSAAPAQSASSVASAPSVPSASFVASAEIDAEYINRGLPATFGAGIPMFKPPYAHVVAIDLSRGAIKWRVPFGDMPGLREELEKRGLKISTPLGAQGPAGLVVTEGGVIFVGGGDRAFHALDTASGRELWSTPTLETTGTPMTYRSRSGRQFVVVATGRAAEATLVAFALGRQDTSAKPALSQPTTGTRP